MDKRRLLHRIILEWQQPIYNLAYRMLGNEADAADATQEIFTRVVANIDRYDAERELAPWLFRIAKNTIYNMTRDTGARRSRESLRIQRLAVASSSREDGSERAPREVDVSDESAENDLLEQKERQEIVQTQMALLSEDERLVVVLHYYCGLSQSELATTLSLPRTTVQSRLGRALGHLKRRLERSGCLEICPCLEGIMRSAKPLTVPPELTTSLLTLASGAGAPTALVAAGVTIGGIMTNKSLIAAGLLLALLCIAGGFVAGRRAASVDGTADDLLTAEARATAIEEEYRNLQREHRQAEIELEQLRRLIAEQERKLARAASVAPAATAETASGRPAGGVPGDAAAPEAEFDWTRLSALLAENLEAISRSLEADGEVSRLSPEDQTHLMEMYAEFMNVARHGRTFSDQPFFDERFLGPLLESLHTESLGLDEEQQAGLRELVNRLSREYLEPLDLEEALPVEAYGVRQQLLEDFTESMGQLITEEQRGRWDTLRAVSKRLLQGNRTELDLPLGRDGSEDGVRDKVVEHWKQAFSIADDAGRLGPVADAFLQAARQALARHGQTPQETRELSREEASRLEKELLELQINSEHELLRLLTPEERANVPGGDPVFLRFNSRGNTTTSRRRGMPF